MKKRILSFLLKRNNIDKGRRRSALKAYRSFHSVAREMGWYNGFLKMNQCVASDIRSVDDFTKRVPLLSKDSVFTQNLFHELVRCPQGKIHSVMLSSGQSGKFSLGIITRKENRKLAKQTDLFLDLFFGIKRGEALIINASAMGVSVFTDHACCNTGPRSDIALSLLKEVAPNFKKCVITADPHLIKQIAEDLIRSGIDCSKLKIWFISGGDWFPETLRTYVHSIMGQSAQNPENGFWSAIYGLTELGYPLFFETAPLAALRSQFYSDRSLYEKQLTFRQGRCTTPFLFHHQPSLYYLEQVENQENIPELVFTTLDPSRAISLVRYNTHDVGELLHPDAFEHTGFNLPVVAFWGRNANDLRFPSGKIWITDIKELLFSNFMLNEKITGFFTLHQVHENAALDIQLKKGCVISDREEEEYRKLFSSIYPAGLEVSFKSYHGFEEQMELDFERKFNHLKTKNDGCNSN